MKTSEAGAQLVPIFLGYLENTQILENKNFQKQKYLGFCAKQLASLLRGSDVVVQSVPTFLEYTECNEEEETNFAKFHLNVFC